MMKLIRIFGVSIVCLFLGQGSIARAQTVNENQADKIVVEKSRYRMFLYRGQMLFKTYRIALGRSPQGHKHSAGDNRTPEGVYRINGRNPRSQCHLALHISYPNAQDRAIAQKQHQNPGGDIMIHGIKNGWGWIGSLHRWVNWTKGCIAVTDAEMDEIWRLVPNSTVIEIRP